MGTNHKIICVDLEVYEYLRKHAEGFESVNKTVRRVLGLPPMEAKKRGRKKKGVKK